MREREREKRGKEEKKRGERRIGSETGRKHAICFNMIIGLKASTVVNWIPSNQHNIQHKFFVSVFF